jgi:hypothetical protein
MPQGVPSVAKKLQTIRGPFDPLKIFHYAEFYQRAQLHLMSNALSFAPAIIVVSEFSSELFLKCMICLEKTGSVPAEHDLRLLFDTLSVDVQRVTTTEWDRYTMVADSTFKACELAWNMRVPRSLSWALEKGGTAFEKIRYGYEGIPGDVYFVLHEFPRILRSVILRSHPDWEAKSTPTVDGRPL